MMIAVRNYLRDRAFSVTLKSFYLFASLLIHFVKPFLNTSRQTNKQTNKKTNQVVSHQ